MVNKFVGPLTVDYPGNCIVSFKDAKEKLDGNTYKYLRFSMEQLLNGYGYCFDQFETYNCFRWSFQKYIAYRLDAFNLKIELWTDEYVIIGKQRNNRNKNHRLKDTDLSYIDFIKTDW